MSTPAVEPIAMLACCGARRSALLDDVGVEGLTVGRSYAC